MAGAVTGKPPLPAKQNPPPVDMTSSLSKSCVDEQLRTSQQETISDGTILGLKDVFYFNEPDLSYFCSTCNRFIRLLFLRDHKSYHTALQTLGYESKQFPKNPQSLLKRRNQCMRELRDELAAVGVLSDLKKFKRIDDAYERLKQELEDTFESCRKIDEKINFTVEGLDYSCGVEFVSAVSQCSNQNNRWKSVMEDSKVYQDFFGNSQAKAFLALYDGYNGQYASAVAANELHYLLLNEMAKFDPNISCQCTYNMFEENDIAKYDLLRPPTPNDGLKALLHEQSRNHVCQVIHTCEEPVTNSHLSSHHPVIQQASDINSKTSPDQMKGTYAQSMKAAFRRAYKLTDQVLEFGGDEKSRVRWSGCSALTVVVDGELDGMQLDSIAENSSEASRGPSPSDQQIAQEQTYEAEDDNQKRTKTYDPPRVLGKIHVANAGNSHAVLVRDNRVYTVTKGHTYDNEKERKRVEAIGGRFHSGETEMRINGVSLTTRGLGNHGDPSLKSAVTWEPYCQTVPIDQYCQMLILATAGVWQVLSYQEAAELLLQMLPQNRIPSPKNVSPSVAMLNSVSKAAAARDEHRSKEVDLESENSGADNDKGYDDVTVGERQQHTADHPTLPELADGELPKDIPSGGVTFDPNVSISYEEEPQVHEQTTPHADRLALDENDHDDVLLPDDIRSLDSGNEADVDTDWASTFAPNDLSRLSLASKPSNHRELCRLLSERLVQSALLAGSKENLSAVVLLLPGVQLPD